MINIGTIQKLKISEINDIGAYLYISSKEKILLPKKQVNRTVKVGDEVSVFLYNDSKSRPIATIKKPLLTVGDVASLRVVDKTKIGCFLDIGLERDLLLPFSEMMGDVEIGDMVKVLMYVDKSKRLCATMYTNKNFDDVVKNKRVLDKNEVKTRQYELGAEKVYKRIRERFKGHLLYTDKTADPKTVRKDFNMSKAEFKRSIGKLLKDEKIKINQTGIYTY